MSIVNAYVFFVEFPGFKSIFSLKNLMFAKSLSLEFNGFPSFQKNLPGTIFPIFVLNLSLALTLTPWGVYISVVPNKFQRLVVPLENV